MIINDNLCPIYIQIGVNFAARPVSALVLRSWENLHGGIQMGLAIGVFIFPIKYSLFIGERFGVTYIEFPNHLYKSI